MLDFESLFVFLFKYRPAVYREGELALAAPPAWWWVAGGLAIAASVAVMRYRWPAGRASGPWRVVLAGMRAAAVALLALCLLRPALVLETVVPQESFVAVLADDSQSMRVADQDGRTRGAEILRQLDPTTGGGLVNRLGERFRLRQFGFSAAGRSITSVAELDFSGRRSNLGAGLADTADALAGVPVAGIILLSDGADSSGEALTRTLIELRARQLPVYPIGLGRERFERDLELLRIAAPASVLAGSSLQVQVTVRQRGFSGRQVGLEVEDQGRIVSVSELTLSGDPETTAEVGFTLDQPGARLLRFRLQPQDGEEVADNNQRPVLVRVTDEREKILYFEGEPRFELKFLRRAVAEDQNLQLVCLQRTAENKYLRLDVDSPEELANGFPTTREELYAYRGLVLGSVEASFFTHDQLRMIAEFVSDRGGGLLVLGGRRALGEGGYAATPLADALPVNLLPPPKGEEPAFASLRIELTPSGRAHPALLLLADREASLERWRTLPPLLSFNRVFDTKPGATALLVGRSEGSDRTQVVLAHQRYGRGRAMVFTPADSWRWQMHHDVPLEDLSHETLWRQLLRWLVVNVPDPVSVVAQPDVVGAGEQVKLRAEVRDAAHLPVSAALVEVTTTAPSGSTSQSQLEWTLDQDGVFAGDVVATEEGLHEVELVARSEGRDLGTAATSFVVGPFSEELFSAERRRALLERIAKETGGRSYGWSELGELVEDLSLGKSGATVRERRDLWDMPAIFLALLALVGGEWLLRRRLGLR